MINSAKFVKSFSKGQITIPKELREQFGLGNDFWLKIYIDKDKLIAEPVSEENKQPAREYAKKLLRIKGEWFSPKELQKTRAEIEKRLHI